MLDLNPDTVCAIIERAREFQAKEEVVIPEEPGSPSGDWARQILAAHADDLTYQETTAAIRDLEPDQQICLVALMWLGRGDYALDEWDTALSDAAESWNERTAEYLLATPLVAGYLAAGLEEHALICE